MVIYHVHGLNFIMSLKYFLVYSLCIVICPNWEVVSRCLMTFGILLLKDNKESEKERWSMRCKKKIKLKEEVGNEISGARR